MLPSNSTDEAVGAESWGVELPIRVDIWGVSVMLIMMVRENLQPVAILPPMYNINGRSHCARL